MSMNKLNLAVEDYYSRLAMMNIHVRKWTPDNIQQNARPMTAIHMGCTQLGNETYEMSAIHQGCAQIGDEKCSG